MPKVPIRREWEEGIPLPRQLWNWGILVRFSSRIKCAAPAKIGFYKIGMPEKPPGGTYFTYIFHHISTVVVQLCI